MTQIARTAERRLQAERLIGPDALREAQALRYAVFSSEFDAKLKGAELGLDMDDFDPHCSHIGVRDLNSGAPRMPPPLTMPLCAPGANWPCASAAPTRK